MKISANAIKKIFLMENSNFVNNEFPVEIMRDLNNWAVLAATRFPPPVLPGSGSRRLSQPYLFWYSTSNGL
jgi:hypothetical protein